MKRFLTSALLVVLVLGAAVFALPASDKAMAHETDEEHSHEEESQAEQPQEDEDYVIYSYSAQPGDSYSLIARKATQTFGLKYEVALSEAAILYIETNLTKQAGSPELEVSQHIEISEQVIGEWVEKVKQLPESELANWEYYVQFANFNTDHVGQES